MIKKWAYKFFHLHSILLFLSPNHAININTHIVCKVKLNKYKNFGWESPNEAVNVNIHIVCKVKLNKYKNFFFFGRITNIKTDY